MWKIRDVEIQIGQGLFHNSQFVFNRLDPFADGPHGNHGSIRRPVLTLQLGNVFRSLFQFMTKLLGLASQTPTLFDQRADVIPRDISAARAKLFPDGIEIVAEGA